LLVDASGNPDPACQINDVSANELVSSSDVKITSSLVVAVAAKSAANGQVREYTITITVVTAYLLTARVTATLTVPHDGGRQLRAHRRTSPMRFVRNRTRSGVRRSGNVFNIPIDGRLFGALNERLTNPSPRRDTERLRLSRRSN